MVTTNTLMAMINVVADVKQATKAFKELGKVISRSNKNAVKLNRNLDKSINRMQKLSNITAKQNQFISNFAGKGVNKMKAFQGALMGAGFGFLFQGMMIQRFFLGLGKSMLDTYMLAEGQNSIAVQQLNQIQGAWEYIKWGIADAIIQSGVLNTVYEKVMEITDWFANLTDGQKGLLGSTIVWGIVLSSIAVLIGAFLLTLLGVLSTVELIGITFSSIKTTVALITGSKVATTFATWAAGAWAVAGPFITIGAAIVAVLGLLFLARSYTNDWGSAFELMGWSIVRSLQIISSYLLTSTLIPIIAIVNAAIAAYNIWKIVTGQTGQKKLLSIDSIQNGIDNLMGADYVQQKITAIMATEQAKKDVAAEQAKLDASKAQTASGSNTTTTNAPNITNIVSINASQGLGEGDESYARRMANLFVDQANLLQSSTAK